MASNARLRRSLSRLPPGNADHDFHLKYRLLQSLRVHAEAIYCHLSLFYGSVKPRLCLAHELVVYRRNALPRHFSLNGNCGLGPLADL